MREPVAVESLERILAEDPERQILPDFFSEILQPPARDIVA